MDPASVIIAALVSGALIGLILGLVGGGGSILAVPLLVYFVGVGQPHYAIGTAAIAVTLNALSGLIGHARHGNIRWPCAFSFALAGVAGAGLGAELGKAFDGERLVGLFGVLMVVVGLLMLRGRGEGADPDVRMTLQNARPMLARIVPTGFAVGLMSGFFGIGGGFLIVPGMIFATGMPITLAIGSSLFVITALGATTAASYAASGLIDWSVVLWLVIGGIAGTMAGRALGGRLSAHKRVLARGFAALVILIGLWVAWQSVG